MDDNPVKILNDNPDNADDIGVTGVFAPLCAELVEVSGDGLSAMDGASTMG